VYNWLFSVGNYLKLYKYNLKSKQILMILHIIIVWHFSNVIKNKFSTLHYIYRNTLLINTKYCQWNDGGYLSKIKIYYHIIITIIIVTIDSLNYKSHAYILISIHNRAINTGRGIQPPHPSPQYWIPFNGTDSYNYRFPQYFITESTYV